MPEGRTNKMADLKEISPYASLVCQTYVFRVRTPKCNVLYLCVQQHPALLALLPSVMTDMPLFYVVTTNNSDYVHMLIRPSDIMP